MKNINNIKIEVPAKPTKDYYRYVNNYDNIKKAIHFLISTNIGEIVTIFFGLILGMKSPLLAIQLLWINLVTDSLPAIALGLEKEEENIIECDGLFVSIGRKPTTDFLDNQIELDNKGYIVAGENTETSIPGVYAVGDVRTKLLRQIVTAVADGAMAVHMAEEYMEK
jgi:hypothetical protein